MQYKYWYCKTGNVLSLVFVENNQNNNKSLDVWELLFLAMYLFLLRLIRFILINCMEIARLHSCDESLFDSTYLYD